MPLFNDLIATSPVERAVIAGCDASGRLYDFVAVSDYNTLIVGNITKAVSRVLAHPRVEFLIMAHNHPCGTPTPSSIDIDVTKRMAAFVRLGGGVLVDHLLYADAQPQSFRALGLL